MKRVRIWLKGGRGRDMEKIEIESQADGIRDGEINRALEK